MAFDIKDIKFTEKGDVEFENGDLALANFEETLIQEIRNRLNTSDPDWFYHMIGSNLEDIMGEDNIKKTAEIGKEKIINSLTGDGFLEDTEFEIRYVPISHSEIIYFIKVYRTDADNFIYEKTARI